MSEEQIKKQSFIVEYDKTRKPFKSKCAKCKKHNVTPFDFKCELIQHNDVASINNILPTCKNCYSESSNKPQTNVYKKVQELVYEKYYDMPKIKCFCCRSETLTPFNFVGGHVIARARGGEYTINNLKPICSLCNGSMGVQNMYDFMYKYLCIDVDGLTISPITPNVNPSVDDEITQQMLLDDAKKNHNESKYKNYVLIRTNKTPREKHIKERVNLAFKYINNKGWTLGDMFTKKKYLTVKVKNDEGHEISYDLNKIKYDVKFGYIKFVKPQII
jgi:hypothetical protein